LAARGIRRGASLEKLWRQSNYGCEAHDLQGFRERGQKTFERRERVAKAAPKRRMLATDYASDVAAKPFPRWAAVVRQQRSCGRGGGALAQPAKSAAKTSSAALDFPKGAAFCKRRTRRSSTHDAVAGGAVVVLACLCRIPRRPFDVLVTNH